MNVLIWTAAAPTRPRLDLQGRERSLNSGHGRLEMNGRPLDGRHLALAGDPSTRAAPLKGAVAGDSREGGGA